MSNFVWFVSCFSWSKPEFSRGILAVWFVASRLIKISLRGLSGLIMLLGKCACGCRLFTWIAMWLKRYKNSVAVSILISPFCKYVFRLLGCLVDSQVGSAERGPTRWARRGSCSDVGSIIHDTRDSKRSRRRRRKHCSRRCRRGHFSNSCGIGSPTAARRQHPGAEETQRADPASTGVAALDDAARRQAAGHRSLGR